MLGCRSAAAAKNVDEPRFGHLAQLCSRVVGQLVVLSEGIRQPRVRIAADPTVGDTRERCDVRAHRDGAEGTVDTHRERARVGNTRPERLDSLSRERATRVVRDRHGNHQWNAAPKFLKDELDRDERRLCVQRVEDRLKQQQIHAALDQSTHLLLI